jgi:hypothetical protein
MLKRDLLLGLDVFTSPAYLRFWRIALASTRNDALVHSSESKLRGPRARAAGAEIFVFEMPFKNNQTRIISMKSAGSTRGFGTKGRGR